MELSLGLLALLATLASTIAQQQPQIAPQSAQQAPHARSAPLLGVRYSASTDVSKMSFTSPLVTYGDSLNEIQLPAAPIRPANLRQASQEDNSLGEGEEDERETLARTGIRAQNQLEAEPQNQVTQAIQPQTPPSQQYISIQQYPARPQLQTSPRGFSLRQNLPGPQPQAPRRYASQYQPLPQAEPQYVTGQQPYAPTQQQYTPAQPQYALAQPQYPTAQPQYTVAQPQYATAQPQYTPAQPQYATAQPQYATAQPQYNIAQPQYPIAQPQPQYPSPVAYSSPSSNAYFATGQYSGSNLVGRQYPAQLPVAAQPIAAQYAQPHAQQVAAEYAQPTTPQFQAPAQVVSRVAFSGPVGGFSYSF